jgi:hypothetical protein
VFKFKPSELQKQKAKIFVLIYVYFAFLIAVWIEMAIHTNKWVTILITWLFVLMFFNSFSLIRIENRVIIVDHKFSASLNLLAEAVTIQAQRITDINNWIISRFGKAAKPQIH